MLVANSSMNVEYKTRNKVLAILALETSILNQETRKVFVNCKVAWDMSSFDK